MRPRTNLDCIPQTTIFNYDLAPYNGTQIDADSLAVNVILSGGPTGINQRFPLTKESTQIKLTGDSTSGYNIKIDLFPHFSQNLESNQRVEVRIAVKDTGGNSMRTFVAHYITMHLDHYDALCFLLRDIMDLPVDYEQGRINSNGTEVDFSYKNWSLISDPKIYKNNIPLTTGYTVDKTNGKLRFNTPIRHQDVIDVINVDYRFGVFSDEEIIGYIQQALATYNGFRPQTYHRISNTPQYADAAMTLGAAYYALQSVLLGFVNQQARVKWGETDWEKLTAMLEGIKSKYQDEFNKILEEKRYHLAASASIITPEFTLPGGRSRFFRYMFKEGGV